MIETESSEYLETFQLHIEQARARISAAVLPLLEHKTGAFMPGQRADITSVKLTVSLWNLFVCELAFSYH